MSVAGLREAFNAVSEPAFTCTLALLDYERETDPETRKLKEWQVLLFRGTSAVGAPFEIKSDRLPGGIDFNNAAKIVAQNLLDRETVK